MFTKLDGIQESIEKYHNKKLEHFQSFHDQRAEYMRQQLENNSKKEYRRDLRALAEIKIDHLTGDALLTAQALRQKIMDRWGIQ